MNARDLHTRGLRSPARQAYRVLVDEFGEREVDLALAVAAVDAAAELAPYPRTTWAVPRDAWERTVVAVAVVLRRLEGSGIKRRDAVRATREALRELEREGRAA